MANGSGSLSSAWRDFDDATKLNLAVTELDRIYSRIERHDATSVAEHAQIRREFHEVVDALREEVRDGFREMERRDARKTALFYTMIGGIVVGLLLLVAQLATG